MKNILRPNIDKLTKMWDSGLLKECYCLVFSHTWGFRIIWNDEEGNSHTLKDNSEILQGYFVVLAVYESEDQAKTHFYDFVKWAEIFNL